MSKKLCFPVCNGADFVRALALELVCMGIDICMDMGMAMVMSCRITSSLLLAIASEALGTSSLTNCDEVEANLHYQIKPFFF